MLAALAAVACLTAPDASRPSTPPVVVAPAEFQRDYETAKAGRSSLPRAVENTARGYRFVFVGGFRNERMPAYFSQNVKELRRCGVPRTSIHRVEPGSDTTVEGNAKRFREEVTRLSEKGPEPLIVIAHSRGACDAVAFALENPEFVEARVAGFFLLQGPFGGTALADFLAGDGPPVDGRMSWWQRGLARLAAAIEGFALSRGWHDGLLGLSRRSAGSYWAKMLAEHAPAVPLVSPRIYYVTSATERKLGLFHRATSAYLGVHFGPNDGVVAVEDQSIRGLGTVLAELDLGHADLVRRFPAGRANPRLRTALVDAILMSLPR
ncbi:MAG: hypothetical protein U0835_08895 [Isosphaeraceae bacterium]